MTPCGLLFPPILGGAAGKRQVPRRVDQAHVRERLRKIADQPAVYAVVLLGQQAHVVAQREQALEVRARQVTTAEMIPGK